MKESKDTFKSITDNEKNLNNEEHIRIFAQKLFDKTIEKIRKDLKNMLEKDRASKISVIK